MRPLVVVSRLSGPTNTPSSISINFGRFSMREQHSLTVQEERQFKWLKPEPGEAIEFWGGVAHRRGLDYTTLITAAPKFSALPYDHGKQWCWPMKLKCNKRVKFTEPVPDVSELIKPKED